MTAAFSSSLMLMPCFSIHCSMRSRRTSLLSMATHPRSGCPVTGHTCEPAGMDTSCQRARSLTVRVFFPLPWPPLGGSSSRRWHPGRKLAASCEQCGRGQAGMMGSRVRIQDWALVRLMVTPVFSIFTGSIIRQCEMGQKNSGGGGEGPPRDPLLWAATATCLRCCFLSPALQIRPALPSHVGRAGRATMLQGAQHETSRRCKSYKMACRGAHGKSAHVRKLIPASMQAGTESCCCCGTAVLGSSSSSMLKSSAGSVAAAEALTVGCAAVSAGLLVLTLEAVTFLQGPSVHYHEGVECLSLRAVRCPRMQRLVAHSCTTLPVIAQRMRPSEDSRRKGTHQVFESVLPNARTSCSFIETCSASCRAELLMADIFSHLPGHLRRQGAPFRQLRESAQAPQNRLLFVSVSVLNMHLDCSAAVPRPPAEEGKRGTPAEDASASVVQSIGANQQRCLCHKASINQGGLAWTQMELQPKGMYIQPWRLSEVWCTG